MISHLAMEGGLPSGEFVRLWRMDLDGDREPEVLVQYDAQARGDRYAAFSSYSNGREPPTK